MLKVLINRVRQRPGIAMALLGVLILGLLGLSAWGTSPVAQEGPRVPATIPVLLAAHDGAGVAQQRFREVLRQRSSARWVGVGGGFRLADRRPAGGPVGDRTALPARRLSAAASIAGGPGYGPTASTDGM